MFGSEILDVAIGMVFIYLLLSLVCSAVGEALEHVLKNRPRFLERALREMLNDPQATDLVARVYNHGLIYSLFEGDYNPNNHKNLPSYLPPRSFALALMDIILPGGAAGAGSSGATGATAAPASADPQIVVNTYTNANPPIPPAPPPAPANPVLPLRNAIENIQNVRVRQSLRTIVDAAGSDVTAVRQNIEDWYNSSMDRASGWYKRRAQLFIFGIGLALAVGINVNSISLANNLWVNKAQRDALVAAAQNYSNQEAAKGATAAPQTPGGTTGQSTATNTPETGKTAQKGTGLDPALEASLRRLNRLGLRIGWHFRKSTGTAEDSAVEKDLPTGLPSFEELGTLRASLAWVLILAGWFITAFAISLGAPFWFDLLNKFMQARSAMKPADSTQSGSAQN